jgi:RHS repeat-associated protein
MDRSKGAGLPLWKALLLPVLLFLAPCAIAQVDPDVGTYAGDYSKKISAAREVKPLDENLFGDAMNPYTGRVDFSVTDVSLPGNSALPVAFARRYQFDRWVAPGETGHRPNWMLGPLSDWDIDLPYMHARFPLSPQYSPRLGWQTTTAGMRCSQPNKSQATPTVNSGYIPEDFWFGNYLYLPGKGDQELIFVETQAQRKAQGPHTYRWATKDGWYFSCLPSTANGVEGEAFLAHAPDGTRYWFNQFAGTVRSGEPANKRDGLRSGEVRILLTRVEDRFGNHVVYEYAADSDAKLLSITANDGRRLTMTYAGPHIKTVSDGTRTWTYTYGDWQAGTVADQTGFLWYVQQPDGSRWTYTTLYAPGVIETDSTQCGVPSSWLYAGDMVFDAIHPSGARGRFVFNMRRHGRTHVPKACRKYTTAPFSVKEYVPLNFATVSLSRKELTGSGMVPRVWQWTYQQVAGRYDYECTGGGCPTSRAVTMTRPDGSFLRQTYGIHYGVNDGMLLSAEQIATDGVTVLSRQNNTYQLSAVGQNYEAGFGSNFRPYADPRVAHHQPLISALVTEGGVTYEWRVPMCGAVRCLDAHARPTRTQRISSLGYSRSDSIEYHDDPVAWVTGHVRRRINLDTGIVESEVEFNAQSLPWRAHRYGRLVQTLTYWPDGSLNTSADGRGYITSFSAWKRGIPQSIQYPSTQESPAGAVKSAVVNDLGWIVSVTDENGYATGYGYDVMGRLASIVHPTGDAVAYNNTLFDFRALTDADWKPPGVVTGQWRQYEQTGNRVKISYMDALWRPVLTHEYDAANIGPTLRATRTEYDAVGRESFRSYPSSDLVPGSTGTRTYYDALDRVVRMEQDSEIGVLVTRNDYLDGLRVRTTNPRGFETVTSFAAWEQPGYDLPVLIQRPEDKIVQIARHPQFGWPLSMTQRNGANTVSHIRRYVYDGNARLCKTIEPETGATVTGYDAAGNPVWSASGLSGGDYADPADCSYTAASASGRVVGRAYDARNRLTTLSFPDGRGNQVWRYTPDNLPASISTFNDSGNATEVINAYTYNRRRLLIGESVTQPGWYTWSMGYAYDANGSLALQTYPTGLNVDYAPNALGQATRAGSFASNASYYPNGALRQFTYGNGIVHTMVQNLRQMPSEVRSTGVLHDQYAYDAAGNVAQILDAINGPVYSTRNRWMLYDGLDRLTGAGAGMFGGTDNWHRFTYDALDNLKSWKLAGVKDYADYIYDGANRLTSIRNTAGATVMGLAYDPQGNLSNRNGQTFDFDHGNRLRSVIGKEYFRYDGHGRRVLNWRHPDSGAAGGSLSLSIYSREGQLMLLWDDQYPKNSEHVYLAGSLIAIRDIAHPSGAITVKYQHTDALGSPVVVTGSSGQVLERNDYEPYGAIIGKPSYNGVGYTGHFTDGVTGLTYMQQRYYDASLGLFLSVDPVSADSATGVNFNRYWYANNNPYKFVDPDGRKACTLPMLGADICDLPEEERNREPEKPQPKTLTNTPQKPTQQEQERIDRINKAIERARQRVEKAGTPEQVERWNNTTWRWDPNNLEFVKDPSIAAFVRPSDPNTIHVGSRLAEFADTSMTFTYQNARFHGGDNAMLFVVLHEFGHVATQGQGSPGVAREELANKFAYKLMDPRSRREIVCTGCRD